MYAAKAGGKGRWALYEPELDAGRSESDGDRARVSWAMRSDEQRAQILSLLDRPDAVRTVFQPIIDLRTGEIAAYEALSRFDGPVDHPPNVWFEQAHRCGLGYRLEALAFERALSAPGRPDGTYLTVNLSLSSLASEEVRAVLPERPHGRRHRDHRERARHRQGRRARRDGARARARRAARRRRRGLRLRRAAARHAPRARRHQARPRARRRRRGGSRQGGAHRGVRPLRPPDRRDDLRRGHRDARRPRGARRHRRRLRPGLGHRPAGRAVGPGLRRLRGAVPRPGPRGARRARRRRGRPARAGRRGAVAGNRARRARRRVRSARDRTARHARRRARALGRRARPGRARPAAPTAPRPSRRPRCSPRAPSRSSPAPAPPTRSPSPSCARAGSAPCSRSRSCVDGRLAGAVEFYAAAARVWSRFDVRQARTAGHHVAAALARTNGRGLAPGPAVDAFAEALDA